MKKNRNLILRILGKNTIGRSVKKKYYFDCGYTLMNHVISVTAWHPSFLSIFIYNKKFQTLEGFIKTNEYMLISIISFVVFKEILRKFSFMMISKFD